MVFEGLVKVTTLPAIFISSAWVIVSKGLGDGLVFLLITMIFYAAMTLYFYHHEKEMVKLRKDYCDD